jgi:hypothetical protein
MFDEPIPGFPGFKSNGPSQGRDIEGAFRRGFHHAVAYLAEELRQGMVTAQDIETWADPGGLGWQWRKDLPLAVKALPPPFKPQSE